MRTRRRAGRARERPHHVRGREAVEGEFLGAARRRGLERADSDTPSKPSTRRATAPRWPPPRRQASPGALPQRAHRAGRVRDHGSSSPECRWRPPSPATAASHRSRRAGPSRFSVSSVARSESGARRSTASIAVVRITGRVRAVSFVELADHAEASRRCPGRRRPAAARRAAMDVVSIRGATAVVAFHPPLATVVVPDGEIEHVADEPSRTGVETAEQGQRLEDVRRGKSRVATCRLAPGCVPSRGGVRRRRGAAAPSQPLRTSRMIHRSGRAAGTSAGSTGCSRGATRARSNASRRAPPAFSRSSSVLYLLGLRGR